MDRSLRLCAVIAVLLARGAVAAADTVHSSSRHSRALKVTPLPVPAPFAFPKDIAAAARSAASSGSTATFATDICNTFARKDIQGSREYRDVDGVKLYPMFLAFVRAGYVYADVSETLARVLMKCDEMGGMAAEGVGYGIAFIYSKGMVDSEGLTKMLNFAYDQGGGCSAVDQIMDVAAAVIKARDVALDELHLAIASYSPKLQPCTPKDSQQRFKAYSLTGDVSVVKPKGSLSLTQQPGGGEGEVKGRVPPPPGSSSSNGAGTRGGPRVAMERGSEARAPSAGGGR